MNAFTYDDLTSDLFGRLCHLAMDKCNDKAERRKSGCGGRAMRKRVLIKNFVSDLFKHNESTDLKESDKTSDEEREPYEDGEDYEDNEANTSMCHHQDEEEDCDEEPPAERGLPENDCWLSGAPAMPINPNHTHYSGYLPGSSLLSSSSNDYSPNMYYDLDPSLAVRNDSMDRPTNPVLSEMAVDIYDIYSNVSEGANEGGQPEPNIPLGSYLNTPLSELDGSYDLGVPSLTGSYDFDFSPTLNVLGDVTNDPSSLQRVATSVSDELFLSMGNGSYSEMKTYSQLSDNRMPENFLSSTHSITDLDSLTTSCPSSPSKKRKSSETLDHLCDGAMFEKRLKL